MTTNVAETLTEQNKKLMTMNVTETDRTHEREKKNDLTLLV